MMSAMKPGWIMLVLSGLVSCWINLCGADYVHWAQDKTFTDGNRYVKIVHDIQGNSIANASGISTRCYLLAHRPSSKTELMSEAELTDLINVCPATHHNGRRRKRFTIYAGTKWCGPGHVARNYHDLGRNTQTDMCCREHDHCPDFIASGSSKYGITNLFPFSRFNCNCETRFYNCLKRVAHETAANGVGNIYFNMYQPMCHTPRCIANVRSCRSWAFVRFGRQF